LGLPLERLNPASCGRYKLRAATKAERDIETRSALMAGVMNCGIGRTFTTMPRRSRNHLYVAILSETYDDGSSISESNQDSQ